MTSQTPDSADGIHRSRYVEIRNAILEDIHSGRITDGQKIASESALCERFGVSRITVRRAMEELAREGAVEKRPGIGTFARVSGLEPSLMSLGGFATATRFRDGPRRIILGSWDAEMDTADRIALGLPEGATAGHLHRILADGDMPLALDLTVYPHDVLPGFLDLVDEDVSTYLLMREHFGHRPSGTQGQLKMGFATSDEASLLKLPLNEAVLRIDKVVGDQDGHPIALSKLVVHPLRVHLRFDAGVPLQPPS